MYWKSVDSFQSDFPSPEMVWKLPWATPGPANWTISGVSNTKFSLPTGPTLSNAEGYSTAFEALSGLSSRLRVVNQVNSPELTSKRLEQWAYLNEAGLDFRGPGKPTDNAFIGGVNGRLRQGSLNENGFLSLEDPEEKVGSWRKHYNGERPHSALGNP